MERRKEREEQARLAEAARRAAGVRAPNSEERDVQLGPSVQFLAKRERARLQAEKLPTLFDLDALPDEVAGAVLRQMGAYELAATACCNKRFRDLARTDDALWRRLQLTCGRHPRWRVDGSWRESFFQGAEKIDANWRRGKFRRLEHRLHSEYTACVAMRGDLGCSGSADHDLAIFGLPPRARVRRCRAWDCCGSARSGGAWATGAGDVLQTRRRRRRRRVFSPDAGAERDG